MADPHSASDDMLSSIRRLVVDHPRAGAADRLVLTPSLRVVSSNAHPKPAIALQTLHLQAPARAGLTTPQLVASVTQGMDDSAMDWEPETEITAPEIDSLDLSRFAQTRNDAQDQAPMAEDVPEDWQEAAALPPLPEHLLRDLVRDLVREQFQGDLGLHITRSIRKLVKAEIAREMDLRAKD